MRKLFLFFVLWVLAAVPAVAQEAVLTPLEGLQDGERVPSELLVTGGANTVELRSLRSAAAAHRLCEVYLANLVDKQFDDAFAEIRPYFPVPDERVAELKAQTELQMGMAERQFGGSVGYTFIAAESLQDALLQFRFLQFFEWDALYWEFIFYKSDGGWVINALGFDDKLGILFD